MKIYVTDDFDRFMYKAKIDDAALIVAATELSQGLHDGNLDMGKLYKKRIASPGQSKRDSNRAIVAACNAESFFFIQGWRKVDVPKQGKEIPNKLMQAYKLFGANLISLTTEALKQSIKDGLLREVMYD